FFYGSGIALGLKPFRTRRSSDLFASTRSAVSGNDASARTASSVTRWRRGRLNADAHPPRCRGRPPTPPSSFFVCLQASPRARARSEEHTSELQSRENLVCRLLPD